MNLFRLSNCPIEAATLNQDLHVKKIIIEAGQLLANCYSLDQLSEAPKTLSGNVRSYSHIHHPISKWVKENIKHFLWTKNHALALSEEFAYRFGKEHFTATFIRWCDSHTPLLPDVAERLQPQCFETRFPELVVDNDPVAGYIRYYQKDKKSFIIRGKEVFASWTNRPVPEFMR